MIWFRNRNHFGDALLQLGILKALHERHGVEIGFIVNSLLQLEACYTADFLKCLIDNETVKLAYPPIKEKDIIDFVAHDEDRDNGLSLIQMWAKSVPYDLSGVSLKPYIKLTSADQDAARRILRDPRQIFVSPFVASWLWEPELIAGQRYLCKELAYHGAYLIGSAEDPKWPGFNHLMGVPIRTVGALLRNCKGLYCIANGIANLAWAVGQTTIYEWITPMRRPAKVPYSVEIKI